MWRARVAGNMAGQLFLRSFERSDRIYNAMLARGYAGHLYTLNPHEMKPADYFATAFAIAAIFAMQVVGRI
jgi:cobalt/nickel transport system permease protein